MAANPLGLPPAARGGELARLRKTGLPARKSNLALIVVFLNGYEPLRGNSAFPGAGRPETGMSFTLTFL